MKLPIFYLKTSAVRRLVREQGKRCSQEFLVALDDLVRRKITAAASIHNGGRKTLDATLVGYVSK